MKSTNVCTLILIAILICLIPLELFSQKSGYCTMPDGTNIYYEHTGSGDDTLVFIHGYAADSSIWHEYIQAFQDTYQVLTFDLRGHGRSSKPHTGYSAETFADDLHQLLTHLAIKKPICIGWSLGGFIAQAYVDRHPDTISKLILISTSACFHHYDDYPFGVPAEDLQQGAQLVRTDHKTYYQNLLTANFNDVTDPSSYKKLTEEFLSILENNDPEVLAAIGEYFAREKPSHIEQLSQIAVPTLVMVGGIDAAVHPGASFYMYTKIIPHAQLAIFPSHGHAFVLTNTLQCLATIASFIHNNSCHAIA